uniref:Uncharacterized protein n=1 Tax=Xanthomonas vasicola pv. vasculorum NCPPB 890 TaxID=1184265 RepID=A0A836P5W5_XANVA
MQDRCNLRHHDVTGLEKWRCERLRTHVPAFHKFSHDLIAVRPRHIGIGSAGIFQGQSHELAAALQAGPVIQLIVHARLRDRVHAA